MSVGLCLTIDAFSCSFFLCWGRQTIRICANLHANHSLSPVAFSLPAKKVIIIRKYFGLNQNSCYLDILIDPKYFCYLKIAKKSCHEVFTVPFFCCLMPSPSIRCFSVCTFELSAQNFHFVFWWLRYDLFFRCALTQRATGIHITQLQNGILTFKLRCRYFELHKTGFIQTVDSIPWLKWKFITFSGYSIKYGLNGCKKSICII